MSLVKKILVASGLSLIAYKAIKVITSLRNLDKNFNYDITFKSIDRIRLMDAQLKATITLTLIIYNATGLTLAAKNVTTVITSSEGALLASTAPVDVSITSGQTYNKQIEVDLNVLGFLLGLSKSYNLTIVNHFTEAGIPISTKPYVYDVGPYIISATNGISWVRSLIASKKGVAGFVTPRLNSTMGAFDVTPPNKILN